MKRWRRLILRALALGVGTVALAVAGGAFWFFLSHRQAVAVSPQLAEVEFAALRGRFAGQEPVLDMSRRETTAAPVELKTKTPLRVFHTVIFDRRGGDRVVRITVPYWFARRFAGRGGEFKWLGQLTFLDDTEFDPEAIRLPIDQLERRGPGLVAYYQHSGGGQFISWVE
jgi:hypothetical protein